jgi:hypothetical protein
MLEVVRVGTMRAIAQIVAWVWLGIATAAGQSGEVGARELYQALNALRVDPSQVYRVRELDLRRDVVRLSLSEGKLAFLTPLNGRVIGAIFTGQGRVLAAPRDPVEKLSLARFLGTPLLDQSFSRAYLRFTDQTGAELQQQLRQAGAQQIEEPSFAEQWNPTVANLNPWHSLRTLADWLSSEPQPYFYAGLVGEVSGPFDVLVDNRQEEEFLLGQPRWEAGARYYDVWASFARADASGRPRLPFVPLAYAIQTSILADRTLEGETLLSLKALRSGERMVALELSRFLTVQAVTDAAGRPCAFFQNEEVNRNEIVQRGNDSLFVILPEAPRAGEEFRLRLTYRGTVISDAGNGVYFVGERGSWYPHIGGASHFASFELNFRWPRRLQLVATGKKLEEREQGDWRIGRCRSEVPIPVAGFNLGEYANAVVDAGNVKIELYANAQLEPALLGRFDRPAVLVPVPRSGSLGARPGSPVPRLTVPEPPPSPAALMKQLGQEIAEAIRFSEKLNGAFPFDRLAISQIPGSFGQGWPGLLYLSTLSFLPAGAQHRAAVSQRMQEQFTELLPFHEVAHQWWGNLVGLGSYRDQWIHEGLANYIALLYADSKKPGGRVLAAWLERYRNELTAKEPGKEETPETAGPLALGYRLRSSKSPAGYSEVVYPKGTWVFHMLRMMLRDPAAKNPDARFAELLQSLIKSHRYRGLTTQELQRAVEERMTGAMDLEETGSMEWFFDQWVRGAAIPRYSVEFKTQPLSDGYLVRGTVKQAGVPETFIASVPVYAARVGGRPILLGSVVASGRESTFQFVSKFRPKRLLIDPQLTLLCLTQ